MGHQTPDQCITETKHTRVLCDLKDLCSTMWYFPEMLHFDKDATNLLEENPRISPYVSCCIFILLFQYLTLVWFEVWSCVRGKPLPTVSVTMMKRLYGFVSVNESFCVCACICSGGVPMMKSFLPFVGVYIYIYMYVAGGGIKHNARLEMVISSKGL